MDTQTITISDLQNAKNDVDATQSSVTLQTTTPAEVQVTSNTPIEVKVTEAHDQTQHFTILEHYPAHEPREDDPHYHFFNLARRSLKKAGKLICWVCGKDEKALGKPVELHHRWEFSFLNDFDVEKVKQKSPELNIETEEALLSYCETENSLIPLCIDHHRGIHGIHCLPHPIWITQAYEKDGLAPVGEIVKQS